MNKTAIEWADFTSNPISGCSRGCSYCYAERMAHRLRGRCGYPKEKPFEPTLHFDELIAPEQRKKAAKIFLVSMGELFDWKVPNVWRYLVFNMARYSPQHTFLVLTKQLFRMYFYMLRHEIPDNFWVGISQDGLTTSATTIETFRTSRFIPHKFVSFEPLLGPIHAELKGIDWVIIGAQTGPGAQQPRKEWLEPIISEVVQWDIPIFIKNNLKWVGERPQEFPEVLA